MKGGNVFSFGETFEFMIEINNKKLCEYCFSEIGEDGVCPHCGSAKITPDHIVLPAGTRLNDKIIIGKVMGKGGFGITYLGYDLRTDKTIAVKEYYPNGICYRSPSQSTSVTVADSKSEEIFNSGAEKFYTEAKMVSQFNGNPNIVSVYDYFRENNTVYLIMEFLSGITLKNYVKRHGVLSDGQALYIMDKIAAALSITHSAGVLHRDISPDNIMICADGKIKLIDFGAAREIVNESSSNLTVVMKPGYTPIEQYTKKGMQGAWTDIYSLGVSVYYALTGIVPDDPYTRMDDDEEFSENKHKINESLWNILKKSTMVNASDRYGSAIDLRKALRSVSAPLKAEEIKLSNTDLLAEDDIPEEKNGSTSAIDDFPATAAVPETTAVPNPEKIQRFEEEISPKASESAEEASHEKYENNVFKKGRKKPEKKDEKTSDKNDGQKTDENDKESPRKFRLPPKITAAVGCGAAVLLIAVLVFVGLGKYADTKAGASAVTVEFVPGISPKILRDDLDKIDGDIKITLTYSTTGLWSNFRIKDGNGTKIRVDAVNRAMSVEEGHPDDYDKYYYALSFTETTDTFAFVIDDKTVKNLTELNFSDNNAVIFKSALLESYDPKEYSVKRGAEYIEIPYGKDEYGSYDGPGIQKEKLKSIGENVRVTLDMEYYSDAEYKYDHSIFWSGDKDGKNIALEWENRVYDPSNPSGDNQFTIGTKNLPPNEDAPARIRFIIRENEINKLEEYLSIWSYNCRIKGVWLEPAE